MMFIKEILTLSLLILITQHMQAGSQTVQESYKVNNSQAIVIGIRQTDRNGEVFL